MLVIRPERLIELTINATSEVIEMPTMTVYLPNEMYTEIGKRARVHKQGLSKTVQELLAIGLRNIGDD